MITNQKITVIPLFRINYFLKNPKTLFMKNLQIKGR